MVAGGGALSADCGTSVAQAQAPQPNIILIMADDLGYVNVGCYGRPDIMRVL